MVAPVLKKATDTDPGDATKYGAPDVKKAFDIMDGSHATEKLQASVIETTGSSDVQTDLDSKAAVSHTHIIADVTSLQTTLDAKFSASNRQTSIVNSEISNVDFSKVTITGTPDGTKFVRDDGSFQSIPGGGDALVGNPLSQFAETTSAQLAGVISDETGSGALVFAESPTLVTPALGTPSSGVGTNLTGIPLSALTTDPLARANHTGTQAIDSTTTGTLPETRGGTDQSTYATGDILFANATNSLAKLAAGTDGEVLTLASGVPSWAAAGGGSSTDTYVLTQGMHDPVIDNGTEFGGFGSRTALGPTRSQREIVIPNAGTIKKLTVEVRNNTGQVNPTTFTVMDGAIATVLTLSYAVDIFGIMSITADAVLAAEALISLRAVNTGNVGTITLDAYSIEVEQS